MKSFSGLTNKLPPLMSSPSPMINETRPIRFVYQDEKGKFRMDQNATATLEIVKEPIGIVSVCGRAHQGKSFILNRGELKESHEHAIKKSLAVFNAVAVGDGSVRKEYENLLHKSMEEEFEKLKRNAFREADLKCMRSIQSMEKRLRAACHSSDVTIDNVLNVLQVLLEEYDVSCHGPGKWKKLALFLQKSFEGPIFELVKRFMDQISSGKNSDELNWRSMDDENKLIRKQLQDSEQYKLEYLQHYDDEKHTDEGTSRINNLLGDNISREQFSSLMNTLDSTEQEIIVWKRKSDQVLMEHEIAGDQFTTEMGVIRSRGPTSDALLAASRGKAISAQGETEDWRRKCVYVVNEAKSALAKAVVVQEQRRNKTQLGEDMTREEFSLTLTEKDTEFEVESIDSETCLLKREVRELAQKLLEGGNFLAQSLNRDTKILGQKKGHLKEKDLSEFQIFDEVQEKCKCGENEVQKAINIADKFRAEAMDAQREINKLQKLAMERLEQVERAEWHVENVEREKMDLVDELKRVRATGGDAASKMALLEARMEARKKETETLLDENNEQSLSTIKRLESRLEYERASRAKANERAESLSLQLKVAQAKLDRLQHELTQVRLNEIAVSSKHRDYSLCKRVQGVGEMSVGFKEDHIITEDGSSESRGDESSHTLEDYRKFTVQRLKRELTKHDCGHLLLSLRNPNKKEILALYEKHVASKPQEHRRMSRN